MRLRALEPQIRVQIEADPALEQDYLGDPPEIAIEDQDVWREYWDMRNSTPADQPLDLGRALEWYERLYGPTDAHVFGRKVRAMDSEFLKAYSGALKAKREGAS